MDTSDRLISPPEAASSVWIGTSNPGFALLAQDELRRIAPGTVCRMLAEGEAYRIELPLARDAALAAVRGREPIFLRHWQPVEAEWARTEDGEDLRRLQAWLAAADGLVPGQAVAIQARKGPVPRGPDGESAVTPAAVKASLDPVLTERGAVPTVQRAERIVSVYWGADAVYAGISSPEDNLSDWSGGAVHFRREEGQISRAKFKLLEAELRFGLDFTRFRDALDIGAAPGGWTSLLLERGTAVTAVDPGDLHPSLLGHPGLTYLKRNASEVRFREGRFDLLVCDMSWSPKLMARLAVELAPALRRGGTAVATLKLLHGKPFQTLKETVRVLEPAYRLVQAKQLFHNREELTLHLERN